MVDSVGVCSVFSFADKQQVIKQARKRPIHFVFWRKNCFIWMKEMGNLHVSEEESSVAGSESNQKEASRVLLAFATICERLVLRNEKCLGNLADHRKMTIFHGLRAPNISILKYLERIYKYTNCSPSCFVVGFIYIDQLIHKQPDLPLISLNVHRLLITSIMVATKLFDDVHYNNSFYARVGGISNVELNSLEIDLLFRLDFRLQVNTTIFEGYCTHLEREIMLAGQRLEKTLPTTASFSSDQRSNERQKMLEDAHRKRSFVMNHNVISVAPSLATATPIESPESPSSK